MEHPVLPTLASDNYAPVHPEILQALVSCNEGSVPAYGNDPWTSSLEAVLRGLFRHPDLRVFPVFNGTGANVVALSSLLRPYESVLCAETAHVAVDECGAIERITGFRLVTVRAPGGKLTPELLKPSLQRKGDIHHAQARVITISQTTEYGTLYSFEELRELADFAHSQGLWLHVDGARASNAVVALDSDFHRVFVETGVDLLSLGATKNGALGAEAILVLNPKLSGDLAFFRKQCGQLSSKQRYVSAQLLALFQGDLWRRNAEHANALAAQLAEGLEEAGLRITQKVEANAVFVELPEKLAHALQEHFSFYCWNELASEYRLMTSFATPPELIEAFLGRVREFARP